VLKAGDDGKIFVWGGARRQTSADIPPSAAPGISLTNYPVAAPDSAPTNAPPKKSKDAKPKSK
jgi:hypothetical protein